MIDNFSERSDSYAKYRPKYPLSFFEYLNSIVPNMQKAWDCGTGNGQVASELAKFFDNVYATDISRSQIDNAVKRENIAYTVQPAENTSFEDNQFDLIIVAQAIHWFDFERFYAEVKRTAKENAIICAIGYGRIQISSQIDLLITHFYSNVIGEYWDKERRYIDENYATIPFPFDEFQPPMFTNEYSWTLQHLMGYLNTWSAVKHFIKQNGYNPIENLQMELEKYWGKEQFKEVRFPLLLRVGRINKI